MFNIEISDIIRQKAPGLKIIMIEADVCNPPTSDALWNEIGKTSEELKKKYKLQELNQRPAIEATRKVYKALGKDPNRYRPSAEALSRRIIQGKGIYRRSTLIDIINLISIKTGYSIGGFDSDKINGNELLLDVGKHDDIFNAIGRGLLNIEGLPVYRDRSGGIGTPTSDEERTKLSSETKKLLMLVNIYGEENSPNEIEKFTECLLKDYAGCKNFLVKIFAS